MRLGIRAKLIGTLLLAGLLPLALALVVILIGVVELRINSKGQTFCALAQQQARNLSTILASQVEVATLINSAPGTVEFLEDANTAPPPTAHQIKQIEDGWGNLSIKQPPLDFILNNPIARRWQAVNAVQRRFAEVMVTDAEGRLVAATNKTTDYFQADEKWWQNCYADGKGKILISDVIFDASALSPEGDTGTLVVDLCMPIFSEIDAARRKVVGIVKISLDATWMLSQLDLGPGTADFPRAVWLVRGDGKAIPGAKPPPPFAELPAVIARRVAGERAGWMMAQKLPGSELIGYAAVEQSLLMMDQQNQWHVVAAAARTEVLGSIHRMVGLILLLGVLVIVGGFTGGLYLARREFLRPLYTLERAVEKIRHGDRDFRLPDKRGSGQIFRDDEIGALAADFNVMAQRLKENFIQIEQADALKRQFIDLASHELRTPVTYIQGAAQLAQRQNGAPGSIMSRIHSRAQRLSRIVENMFKLLAADRFDKGLRIGDTNIVWLIDAVKSELDPFLKERHQHWRVDLREDLPIIQADPEKVRDILSNLVSNAIRFSPDGAEIGISAFTVDWSVEIAVSDTGPGIPKSDIPNLFTPFFTGTGTVDQHSSGDYGHMTRGVGLGLSVVKRFVDLHGGTVRVDTSPDGTTVRVRLPINSTASSREVVENFDSVNRE
jgi:signal transduction histidine kinase